MCRVEVWGCTLLPSRLLRGCGEKVEGELRPESLGKGVGALAAGYPRLGWPGCPGTPWGRRLPTSAVCETTARVSVTEVLRVRSRELTRCSGLRAVTARGEDHEELAGGQGGPGARHLPSAWGGRCPVLVPPTCGSCVCGGGRVAPPNGCTCPVPWVQTPIGAGTKRPAASPPPATTAR